MPKPASDLVKTADTRSRKTKSDRQATLKPSWAMADCETALVVPHESSRKGDECYAGAREQLSLSSINNQLTLRTHEDRLRHARSGSRCQQGRTL